MEFITETEWGKKKVICWIGWFVSPPWIIFWFVATSHSTYISVFQFPQLQIRRTLSILYIHFTGAAWNRIFWFKQEYVPSLHSSLQLQNGCCLSRFARFLYLIRLYFFLWMWHSIVFASKNVQNFKEFQSHISQT